MSSSIDRSLKILDFCQNQLKSIDSIVGSALSRIESLILYENPLLSIENQIQRFSSLKFLDLSSTAIKTLFDLSILPNFERLFCRQCQAIEEQRFQAFLSVCTNRQIQLDLSRTQISSISIFDQFHRCLQNLVLNDQNRFESIHQNQLLQTSHLASIEIQRCSTVDFIHLNVYDRLTSIIFNDNPNLNQVILYLKSNFTYLKYLSVSRTSLTDLSINFSQTSMKFLHVETIELTDNQLESLDFISNFVFSRLDVSRNRLKIIDIPQIDYPAGIYDLSLMNFLNLSSNQIERIRIHWTNESPHLIDLSDNQLESLNLHGQTTFSLRLTGNRRLSLRPNTFQLFCPNIQLLDLTSIDISTFEQLFYINNLSNLHTLIVDDNQLAQNHRQLNWNVFLPWQNTLSHLSLQNMSIESIVLPASLNDFDHLLMVNFHNNLNLRCDCSFQPFVDWLKIPPPNLPDYHQAQQKFLRIECSKSLYELNCHDRSRTRSITYKILIILPVIFIFVVLIAFISIRYRKYRKHQIATQSYRRIFTDADIITMTERNSDQ